ncbi:MAG: DUF6934 family protein [Agriterribacter sp.]
MSNTQDCYEFNLTKSDTNLLFIFMSKGNKEIVKAIQYQYVNELGGRGVYNLGFGNYDVDTDTMTDDTIDNNGDVYKVFNTVLSTIPIFFENNKDAVLLVQGSDSKLDFIEKCRQACSRKCEKECKKANRRINIYRGHLDKNYNELSIDFQFMGGIKSFENHIMLEEYECRKKYDTVLLLKKNV